jgi:hypothetical protein
MKQKELVEALARTADSDAINNEPTRIPILSRSYLRNAFVNFPTGAAASNCGAMLSPSRTRRNSGGRAG